MGINYGGGGGAQPHAICIPFPAQGHVNPMMQVAKLLHHKGFHITFVHTEYNRNRLINSLGPAALAGFPGFRFETIPDGLPPSADDDVTQDIPSLCDSFTKHGYLPFRNLILKLNDTASSGVPPVSCIVSDGVLSFTLRAAEEFGIPEVVFWTMSACGFLGYVMYRQLVKRGLVPLQDATHLTNGYLDTVVNGIPGMRDIQLRDFPSFIRTTNPEDFMLNFMQTEAEATDTKASAIIVNTFDSLEKDVLSALSSALVPPIYSIGPLQLMLDQIPDTDQLKTLRSNLWKDQTGCLQWLESHDPRSVVYVNFGSITVMTPKQLIEFAWGLANSKKPFLWIIRPDIVSGESGDSSLVLPQEFVVETKDRGMLASWCPQEQVLNHSSIGGFLTHSGWNSTLESICGGVPVICWPFFGEQPTNCRFSRVEWGIGMEIDSEVKRDEVEKLVRELMEGSKGKEMKKKAMQWKVEAEQAAMAGGSSFNNLDKLVDEVLLQKKLTN
ncbi:hypothetical protein Ancab_017438 [Ancistrocladus abbreviatus]